MENSGLLDKLAFLTATWFGAGLAPWAPGTVGSLGAVPLALLLRYLGPFYSVIGVIAVVACAVWSAGRVQRRQDDKDPSLVVIDEVAGLLVATLALPFTWGAVCLGFILFRIFDILKPFPIRKLEEMGGGKGIVADDLLAGLYSCISAKVVLFLFAWSQPGSG